MSPSHGVSYHYAGVSQFPRPDFHRQDSQPYGLRTDNARSAEFYRRCKLLGMEGVSLHSYRYAWAERAKTCGYPERFAQAALGHNSKAMHRAYAKNAHVLIPALDEYERKMAAADSVIVPMAAAVA